LSGGGAVQINSNGLYVSRDLDFVSPAPLKEIATVVKALGFEPASGRHFVHPTCPWKDRQALDQAIAVARAHPIDLDAVRRWSQAEGQDVAFDEFARNCEQT